MQQEQDPTLSVKVKRHVLEQVKKEARLMSVEQRKDVTVSLIIRGLVDDFLARRRETT